jgi:anti-sigma B factor antagonist
MRLISDTQERVRVLALAGEIDLHYAPVFRTLLEQPTKVATEALVLDLSQVAFIDSSGIAVIIEHLRSATRHSNVFCVGGMSDAVKQIFEVIHLDTAMPLFETKEAALEALAGNKIKEPPKPLFAPTD